MIELSIHELRSKQAHKSFQNPQKFIEVISTWDFYCKLMTYHFITIIKSTNVISTSRSGAIKLLLYLNYITPMAIFIVLLMAEWWLSWNFPLFIKHSPNILDFSLTLFTFMYIKVLSIVIIMVALVYGAIKNWHFENVLSLKKIYLKYLSTYECSYDIQGVW